MTQTYDPYKLIEDVRALLADRGLTPDCIEGMAGDRLAGASTLLRGLGVEPLMAPEDALDLDGHRSYNARIHGD